MPNQKTILFLKKNKIKLLLLVVFVGWMKWSFNFSPFYPFDDCSFNSELWIKVQPQSDHDEVINVMGPRLCMAEDLAENYLRKGMPRSEIEELLGRSIDPPGRTDRIAHVIYNGAMDYYFFVIHLDSEQRLQSVEYYQG